MLALSLPMERLPPRRVSLEGHGHLKEPNIDDAAGERTISYVTDQAGQVMTRVEGGDEFGSYGRL